MPGLLEHTRRGVLGVPLEPALGRRRVYRLRQPAADLDGGHKDGLPGVCRLKGHLADGVAVLDASEGLILSRNLVVLLPGDIR